MSKKTRDKTIKTRFPEEAPFTRVDEYLLETLDQTVTVQTKDGPEELTLGQLVMRKQVEAAAKGQSHAAGQVTKAYADAQAKREKRIHDDVIDGLIWQKKQQALLDNALAASESTREILPHPDDIIINYSEDYRLIGPCCIEELEVAERLASWRDVYIVQSHLEARFDFPEPSSQAHPSIRNAEPTGSALMYAMNLDHALPRRMRLTDEDFFARERAARHLTKRELLKVAHSAWKSIGLPKPRGWLTESIEQGFEQQLQLMALAQREKTNIKAQLMKDDVSEADVVRLMEPLALEHLALL